MSKRKPLREVVAELEIARDSALREVRQLTDQVTREQSERQTLETRVAAEQIRAERWKARAHRFAGAIRGYLGATGQMFTTFEAHGVEQTRQTPMMEWLENEERDL